MESGAKGCEVVVSGKLRAARAKSMKFTDGFMIHSGQPVREFVDSATRHVLLRQGVLGVKVKIFSDELPGGKGKKPLPDAVFIVEPKEVDAAAVGEPRSVDVNPLPVEAPAEAEGQPTVFEQGAADGYQGEYPQGGYQPEVYQ
jgi:small subunit ribosomal protein S3e